MKLVIDLLKRRAESLRQYLADSRAYVDYLRRTDRISEAEKAIHQINEDESLLNEIEDALEILEET